MMRPVRPAPPPQTPTVEAKPAAQLQSEVVEKPKPETVAADDHVESEAPIEDGVSRFQPIPPPSEPKQYRAIGLIRGCYTPSEEQFTRGEMKIADGTAVEAVLLGRVMSLVKNHLDLTQEHLWVVYPRTRLQQSDLHLQVVGVWEPEKLQKELLEGEEGEALEATEEPATEPESSVEPISTENLTPGYDDDYFSIRGEVIGVTPEEDTITIRIQQSPKKGKQKAKAFKLHLKGTLPSPKTIGYFWELHVKRIGTDLTIAEGNVIGLVPPKKKSGFGPKKGGKPFKRRFDGGGGDKSRAPSGPPPNRAPLPKPSKKAKQNSEG
ncbi:MAG TPA: hypothetical protein IGS53_10210 [Leptolyngbyaceae cyanobacterium M33_DOE_097]|uniref:Uncharacterized protein n=1 Tax=Oscillatoriales cyanobacterium SpSt-418 TaxID=2282169 RepID=A0A7C3KF19_9CYAN|nr:hypothetical protein [Leptolyngbyaceae cyanobacterium M33_DOE_097]